MKLTSDLYTFYSLIITINLYIMNTKTLITKLLLCVLLCTNITIAQTETVAKRLNFPLHFFSFIFLLPNTIYFAFF